jgi:branched-chain amino acid transport system permease protein
MIDFFQTTEGIITAASVYLLVGLSWNLVFNACGYLNLALGQFYILGAIFAYKIESSWGIHSPFLVGPMIAIGVGVLGFISERFLLRPLKDRGLSPLIVTIGINLMLLQLAKSLSPGLVFRPDTFVNGQISPGGVHIAYQELIVWGTAIVLSTALFLFFKRTDLGRSMRASVDNRHAADTLGLKVATYATVAFTVSAMIAAIAAFVVAPTQGLAYNSGDLIAIKAFMAVSIVGIGRNGGAVFGALLVAAAQGYIARYVNADVSDIIVLIGFLLVLYVYVVRSSGDTLLPRWLRVRKPSTAVEAT